MSEAFIAGVGMHPFGRWPDLSLRSMSSEAVLASLTDTEIRAEAVEAAHAALGVAVATLACRLGVGAALAYAPTKSLVSWELDMSISGPVELEAVTQVPPMDTAEFHGARTAKRRSD